MLHRRADFVIVDVDVLVGRIEQVAQHGHCPTRLLECELRTLLRLLRLGDGLFPSTQKHLHLRIKLCDALALRHGAYDHAKFFGLMLWMSCFRRARSSELLILDDTLTFSPKGMRTRKRPAKDNSVVRRGLS